jgi:hypothetical protein
MWQVLRARWPTLLAGGLVVYGPLGLIEVLDDSLQELFNEVEDSELDSGLLVAVIAAAIGHSAAALFGEVLYAGLVAGVVIDHRRGGQGRSLRELIVALPFWRLAAVDVLYVLVVAVGLLVLIVPGLLFLAWFALVAPVVKLEGLGVRAAFGRSRELVRQRTWLVFWLVFPVLVLSDAATGAARSLSAATLGDGIAGEWTGAVIAELATGPVYALVVVILFLELRDYFNSAQTASAQSRRRTAEAPGGPREVESPTDGERPSHGVRACPDTPRRLNRRARYECFP